MSEPNPYLAPEPVVEPQMEPRGRHARTSLVGVCAACAGVYLFVAFSAVYELVWFANTPQSQAGFLTTLGASIIFALVSLLAIMLERKRSPLATWLWIASPLLLVSWVLA